MQYPKSDALVHSDLPHFLTYFVVEWSWDRLASALIAGSLADRCGRIKAVHLWLHLGPTRSTFGGG
jgi:hypothetical protein